MDCHDVVTTLTTSRHTLLFCDHDFGFLGLRRIARAVLSLSAKFTITLKLVRSAAKIMTSNKGFDKILEKVEFLSAGAGKCTAELVVAEEHLNKGETLHGGMTATLVDIISTLALMTNDKALPGVSVDIHVTYMNAAKAGETLLIDACTLKSGKSLAYLDVNITEKITGKIIAKGSHTKYVGQKTSFTEH